MSNEYKGFDPEYDDNKTNDTIYLRTIYTNGFAEKHRKAEMLYDGEITLEEKCNPKADQEGTLYSEKGIRIAVGDGGQQKICCDLVEYHQEDWDKYGKRGTLAFKIARRTSKGVYGSQEITLTLSNALKIVDFIKEVLNPDNNMFNERVKKIAIDDIREKNCINGIKVSEKEYEKLLETNIASITAFEKIAVIKSRQKAIEKLELIIGGEYENETDINHFLKENMWMFGNEYVAFFESGKLNNKNLLDLVPYNSECIMDIVELKLPKEKIILFDNDHENYYVSAKLTKTIGQIQNYIFEAEQKGEMGKTDINGNYKFIKPNGIIVIGSKEELTQEENRYLRILNSSYHNIKIMTYQQLLARAKNSLILLLGIT